MCIYTQCRRHVSVAAAVAALNMRPHTATTETRPTVDRAAIYTFHTHTN